MSKYSGTAKPVPVAFGFVEIVSATLDQQEVYGGYDSLAQQPLADELFAVSAEEALDAWTSFARWHMRPTELLATGIGERLLTEEERKHLQRCQFCLRCYERYRLDRSAGRPFNPSFDSPSPAEPHSEYGQVLRMVADDLRCFSCKAKFTPETAAEKCDQAHREEWSHEWVSGRVCDLTARVVGLLQDKEKLHGDKVTAECVASAIAPVRDWYESDEEHPRMLEDIVRDIVTDLQKDREKWLDGKKLLRTARREIATLRSRLWKQSLISATSRRDMNRLISKLQAAEKEEPRDEDYEMDDAETSSKLETIKVPEPVPNPEAENMVYTMCKHCEHFVDTDVESGEFVHLDDCNQEYDHDAEPDEGMTRTMKGWRRHRPDLFEVYPDKSIGPNSVYHSNRGKTDVTKHVNILWWLEYEKDPWASYPPEPTEDWRHDVKEGNTMQSYRDWLLNRYQLAFDERMEKVAETADKKASTG